ncbi:FecR family protein [Spirosoma sp. BT702]|uniref:FecR family protein n=1 Tax=Spirosoma profusum TaxID=2771354 RepID=A0A927ASN5_9BACT|nr:FecR family protein [Spirosoma profusum]MBD2704143.1 FecR family protein [Spirosoma profusum]
MKNYDSYGAEDFIQDEDFRDWVQGRSSQETFWLSFLQQHPQKQEAFHLAERFIRAASVTSDEIGEAEIRKETEQFLGKAAAYIPHRKVIREPIRSARKPSTARYRLGKRVVLAMLMVVLAGLSWYVTTESRTQLMPHLAKRSTANQLVITANDSQQPLRVVLGDSSEVLLSPKSQLRYPSQFAGATRTVYLKGEAQFSVKRRNQPFMVYTGDMVTKVLGTRFVVRAFDLDKKFTVQVLSGKVSVYKPSPNQSPNNKEVKGLILHANQAAIFEKSDGNLTKTLVTNPALTTQEADENQFVYDEVALPLILREVELSYGIPIQFDEQSFETCKITATLSNESLYEKLDVLCKAASASYEITDGQIVITRKSYR